MTTDSEENDFTYIGFNQNFSSLAVGTKKYFKVFKVKSYDGLEIDREFDWKDVYIFERFFETFMAALVTRQHPKKVVLYNIYENKEMCYFKCSDNILSVRINSRRLLACCINTLHIYDLCAMKELHIIHDTQSNRSGIIALSPRDVCYMAYPGSAVEGIIHIFDADNLKAVSVIPAHNSSVAAMTFNSPGTLLSTASERGTVIRIFSPETSEKLMEFRRGSLVASICSLSFSLDSTYLACSSNSRTVHIFKLKDDEHSREKKAEEEPGSNGWLGYFGDVIQNSATILQSSASYIAGDLLVPLRRSFALTYLPSAYVKNTCAFLINSKSRVLLVATVNGFLYTYAIDSVNGGECALLKQQRFSDAESMVSQKTPPCPSSSAPVRAEGIAVEEQSSGNMQLFWMRPAELPVTSTEILQPEINATAEAINEAFTLTDKPETSSNVCSNDCSNILRTENDAAFVETENEIHTPLLTTNETMLSLPTAVEAETIVETRDASTECVVTNGDIDPTSKHELEPISVSFTNLEKISPFEMPDFPKPQTEDGRLEYGPVPKQTYASIVANKRQGDSPEERKAEAEAALGDAVDGEGNDARKI